MADLLQLSSDVIDGNIELERAGPLNRINHQLSELTGGLAVVEAFSHCIVFQTDDGLVSFDTSNEQGGVKCVDAIRRWSKASFHSVVFTHGHIGHVGGCGAFLADGEHPRIGAGELAGLAGGAMRLAERALALAEDDARLACHLAELAMQAEPEDAGIHALRAEVYQKRRSQETSLMARGIFGSAANESQSRLPDDDG